MNIDNYNGHVIVNEHRKKIKLALTWLVTKLTQKKKKRTIIGFKCYSKCKIEVWAKGETVEFL